MVGGRRVLDEEGFRILSAIRSKGSIALAAEAVGRSYAYAWRYISEGSKELNLQLVDTRIGGLSHGGATLTKYAKSLLDEYDRLLRAQQDLIVTRAKKFHEAKDLSVTGSDCPALRLLLEIMHEEAGILSEVKAVGSAAGLATMMLGEADVVGLHLLDGGTGQYNIPFLRRFWIDDQAVLVRGYVRQQGLIVKRGNPRKISGLDDLTRSDVRFVNRQRGSGTRILLDHVLSQLSKRRSMSFSKLTARIRGYENEVRSHADVVEQILAGRADAGLGMRPTDDDLDFIPIHEELFDFAIDKDRINRREVEVFLRLLSSRKFKETLATVTPGIRTARETGKIVYP